MAEIPFKQTQGSWKAPYETNTNTLVKQHPILNTLLLGAPAMVQQSAGGLGNLASFMLSPNVDQRTPAQKSTDMAAVVQDRMSGIGSSPNSTRLGVPTPAGTAPFWSVNLGESNPSKSIPIAPKDIPKPMAAPPNTVPKPETGVSSTKSAAGVPTQSSAKINTKPSAQYDPRAENFVREFGGQADKQYGAAQDLNQQRLDAELRNAGGFSPLAKLASYGGTMNALNDVTQSMGERGKAALTTAGLGTSAIKQGNVGVEATQDAELKNWLMDESNQPELNAAHANYYNNASRMQKLGLITKLLSAKASQGKDYGLQGNQYVTALQKAYEMSLTNPEGAKKMIELIQKMPQAQNQPGGLSALGFASSTDNE